MVGIDCEWKPTFGLHKNELSLMQIATHNAVFILDVIKLGNKVTYLWQELGNFLFNNCDILKLGNLLCYVGEIVSILYGIESLQSSIVKISSFL